MKNQPAFNGFTPPNYTQIPNEIFDLWMCKLSPAEFKVLLCICRKTFGWHKQRDSISLKQVEKMTGLGRSGIVIHLKNLVELRLIEKLKSKTEDGDDAANQYVVNVNSIGVGSPLNGLPVVHSIDQGGSPLNGHTKERVSSKEETTKEKHTPSSKDIRIFHGSFVKLAPDEYATLCSDHTKQVIDSWILQINDYLASTGNKPYKDYAATIRNWIRRAKNNPEAPATTKGTNPNAEKNLEAFNGFCRALNGFGKQSTISLKGNFVYHTSGDCISLDLEPRSFFDSLKNWTGLNIN